MLNTDKEKKYSKNSDMCFRFIHDLQSCAKEKNYSSIKGLSNVNLYCLEKKKLIQGLPLLSCTIKIFSICNPKQVVMETINMIKTVKVKTNPDNHFTNESITIQGLVHNTIT